MTVHLLTVGQGPAARIAAEPPISGPIWTIVIPAILFIVAFGATYLLYRRFVAKGD
jgi:hypothetical protein